MANAQWKVDERHVAKALGGERIALSGGPGASSKADVIAGDLFVEVKRRQACVVSKWFSECRVKAHNEGKTPCLVVHVAGSSLWLAVVEVPELREFLSRIDGTKCDSCPQSNLDESRESFRDA